MSQSDEGTLESFPTATEATDRNAPEPTDLSRFQIDLLATIARGGPVKGTAIKEAMEGWYGETVHHGRIYPNLDTLAEHGFITKRERDRRTNEYELTSDGRAVFEARIETLAASVGLDVSKPAVADGGREAERDLLTVELVLGADRPEAGQVRLDVTSAKLVSQDKNRLEISLADGEMDEYLAELGLKNRTDEFAIDSTASTESQEGA